MSDPVLRVLCALSYLNPRDRECWYDKRVLGIGERAQARRLGVSASRVWRRVNRADRRLDQLLGESV